MENAAHSFTEGADVPAPKLLECKLNNRQLADKLKEWASSLAKSGGKTWCLQIPVNMDSDPDMLIIEASNRVVKYDNTERDAVLLATLLDEMINRITFTEWDRLHAELAKEGWKRDYLKDLRDKYADRYRNV